MFSARLKRARTERGLTQRQLAQALGITQQAYAKYEKGEATPNPESLRRIAALLDCSLDTLLGAPTPAPPDRPASTGGVWVPVLGRVAAGVPIEALEDVLDYEELTLDTARQGEHFGLQIKGDSMEPRFADGDVVIVRQQPDCESGAIAVVLVNGDEATVKRLKKRPDGLLLLPLNPRYEPIFYSNADIAALPVTILGRVVELRAKF